MVIDLPTHGPMSIWYIGLQLFSTMVSILVLDIKLSWY
jgi:hypothetical protein